MSSTNISKVKLLYSVAVAVAQLKEQSLPIPEVHGSNKVIGKIYIEHLYIEKTKIKKKWSGIAQLKSYASLKYLKPSDWLKLVTPLATTNKSALFQCSIAILI